MEAKLAQQLAFFEQAPLCNIFFDLRKMFNANDQERWFWILKDKGVGRNIRRCILMSRELCTMACWAGGFYGASFKACCRVTQGGPMMPLIFKLMAGTVVGE